MKSWYQDGGLDSFYDSAGSAAFRAAAEGISAGFGDDPELSAFFSGLALLKGVPASYIVPDEAILPPESLRVFFVDPNDQKCEASHF